MITTKINGPVKFLEEGETPFDEIESSDCNCKGRDFCQIVHSGDNTPFQVELSEATGTDLSANGTFTTDVSWTKGTGWTITGGKAVYATGGGELSQTISTLKASTYYKIIFTVSEYSNSETLLVSITGDVVKSLNANGTYTVYWFTDSTLTNKVIKFSPHTSTTLKIDDVQVLEMSTVVYGIKDLEDTIVKTVSNGSGVTYYQNIASIEVDWLNVADGCYRIFLIDNSDNLFTDADTGSFEDVAANWNITEGADVTVIRDTGGFAGTYKGVVGALGSELVTNGGFASSASWSTGGSGMSIGAGVMSHTGAGAGEGLQLITLIAGRTYRITFTITGFTLVSGSTYVILGTDEFGATTIGEPYTSEITGNGSYSVDITTHTGMALGMIKFISEDTLNIDNVSVKLIGAVPSTTTLFTGDTSIPVQSNSTYLIEGYVYFPSAISTANTTGVRLTATGANDLSFQVGQFANGTYLISFPRRVVASSSTGQWIRITTTIGTGDNTSIQIGLYLAGSLSAYTNVSFYIDSIEMRGPLELETECFKVGSFDCTQLLSWSNNENAYDHVYEGTNFQHEIRVRSKLWKPKYPKDKKEVFTFSNGSRKILTSRTKKEDILTIEEMPEYLHDSLSVGVEHDNFYVDGVKYINEETGYEPTWRNSSLLAPVEIELVKDEQNLQNSY
jgi:hypothetical protein